ncbi:AbrB/MazE/SpoVT family DNA-binding domain-containing protein [Peptostreptococcaceae bacterium oral taxon 929]|uniref:AbrB/MazE/SpoVT family DNA-binding domain-containing protein n=1 Tax=Fenollaria massiliensis TaxID=938288 RepID=A0A9E7DJN7_9FIRM|nr:AbrB/MazE/SpoVT family DNA-binding domain-containing protein [Fenollaria massiliensis]AVM67148.1 AbrB/MazE/SpoVT family DNA-binding domain-containing protein [Peptostreptococcaceae bacterium oral taxon 929]UQK59180.1 AbrB/MazE/SpoVT family DNA-binding domain-containing protein [Fenollaria massiliensis]
MLVELKAKSQVTIPKEIVSLMNLNQGDKFEIIEESGRIVLIPLEVYPKNVIDELKASVEEIKASIDNGERPVFDSIDALFEELDK